LFDDIFVKQIIGLFIIDIRRCLFYITLRDNQNITKKIDHADAALPSGMLLPAYGFRECARMNALPVSVVIPALNEESCINRCLVSVLDQDFPREQMEVVVVDNGSTDATASIARQFPVRVVDEARPGVARARNTGIRAARGEIVAFIDADCVAKPDWLRELVSGSNEEKIGCFVGDILPMPGGGLISDFIHDRRLISQEALLSATPPVAACANIAYRRNVFDEIGYFDEKFIVGEDGDLFWRFVKSTRFQYRFQRGAVVLHPHPSSLSGLLRRTCLEGRGLARFRLKHRDDIPKHMTSLSRYAVVFIATLGGCVKYPLRVWRERKTGQRLTRSFAYPFLDKAYSIFLMAGIICELARARGRRKDRN
jgi:glycosyltransferase involved in cell wall biosynthesis